MKMNKLLVTFMLLALIGLLAACGGDDDAGKQKELDQEALDNVNDSGFPIVKEEMTLKMFTAKSDVNAPIDWNELPVWNEYEEMTNIDLDWVEQVTMDSLAEKRNLAIGGGGLPDAFFASTLSNSDLFKYGEQGIFVRLNDLIDDYAPNLKAIMENDPNIEKGMTFPDGNIYSMPGIRDSDFLSVRIGARPWIAQSWLDKLDMDMPETTDEFYDFLTAVKAADEDVIPYSGVNMNNLISWLRGSFGLNNTGADNIDKDPNGDGLRFIPTSDEYREMLEYVRKLYEEELIEQNIFSIEWGQYMANAGEGKYASTVFYDPSLTFGSDDFVSVSALKGPNGDQLYTGVLPPLFNNGQFVVTSENPNPAATVRWMDHFYSDEGARLMYMGIEGESYIEDNGEYKYVDEIENAEHREQKMSEYVPWVGVNPPGLVTSDYFSGSEASEASVEAAEKIKPYVPNEIWSKFTYTKDENKFMNSTGTDIEKYVGEMRDKFISGSESLDDAGWENYVKTIENMGLEEYMNVQTEAYERYSN
ncbi:extracellular solute-binding protein [Lentibacillus saliphilus]|uniref:extracellular solute-binding protein n=1 Tax=Lentibacillus saliphilus TaxID=2737028 RepID=UPI001C2F2EF4|nr:extracellular solute-binding protein [Lentibacillus saliphilus]